MQDNSFRHNHNLLIYTSCIYSFVESISSTQQKQTKRVGQGRGVCHPFAQNSRQPPYPCFCLISLASTTDKLIFESCVLVTYLTWVVALCLPPVLMLIYPSRLARVIFALTDTYHCLNRQTAAHSLDLTNYKAIQICWDIHEPTVPISISHNKASDHAQKSSSQKQSISINISVNRQGNDKLQCATIHACTIIHTSAAVG